MRVRRTGDTVLKNIFRTRVYYAFKNVFRILRVRVYFGKKKKILRFTGKYYILLWFYANTNQASGGWVILCFYRSFPFKMYNKEPGKFTNDFLLYVNIRQLSIYIEPFNRTAVAIVFRLPFFSCRGALGKNSITVSCLLDIPYLNGGHTARISSFDSFIYCTPNGSVLGIQFSNSSIPFL